MKRSSEQIQIHTGINQLRFKQQTVLIKSTRSQKSSQMFAVYLLLLMTLVRLIECKQSYLLYTII